MSKEKIYSRNRRHRRGRGRPPKYGSIIHHLNDHKAYTPASIVNFAIESGLIDLCMEEKKVDLQILKRRIRITLGRFANNHNFPDEGDGLVTLKGQAPVPGWMGWRWKEAYPSDELSEGQVEISTPPAPEKY